MRDLGWLLKGRMRVKRHFEVMVVMKDDQIRRTSNDRPRPAFLHSSTFSPVGKVIRSGLYSSIALMIVSGLLWLASPRRQNCICYLHYPVLKGTQGCSYGFCLRSFISPTPPTVHKCFSLGRKRCLPTQSSNTDLGIPFTTTIGVCANL